MGSVCKEGSWIGSPGAPPLFVTSACCPESLSQALMAENNPLLRYYVAHPPTTKYHFNGDAGIAETGFKFRLLITGLTGLGVHFENRRWGLWIARHATPSRRFPSKSRHVDNLLGQRILAWQVGQMGTPFRGLERKQATSSILGVHSSERNPTGPPCHQKVTQ